MTEKLVTHQRYLDTHFHSQELARKGISPEAELASSFAGELAFALDVAVDDSGWSQRLALAGRFQPLYLSLGFSPAYVTRPDWETAAGRLQRLVSGEPARSRGSTAVQAGGRSKLLAVGEIGLDGYWKYGSPEQQAALLVAQLQVADACGLPVIIHNREADAELLRLLKAHAPRAGGIIHCFSSDYRLAGQLTDLGFLISFAGNLTYKNATGIQEAARRLPLDALLLETDAPYLTPQPVRGQVNRPAFVRYTYEYLAALRGLDITTLQEQLRANLLRLFPALGELFEAEEAVSEEAGAEEARVEEGRAEKSRAEEGKHDS